MAINAADVVSAFNVHGQEGYSVDLPGGPFYVLPSQVFSWVICHGEELTFLVDANGPLIGFPDAESAVQLLLEAADA